MNELVFSHFKNGAIIGMDDNSVKYRLRLEGGRGTASVYPLMPGIELAFLEFRAERYSPSVHKHSRTIELNHCLEGRVECLMGDGCRQYASAGDLMLSSLQNHSDSIELPSGYYKGAVITLDLELADDAISQYISQSGVRASMLAERFFSERESFMLRARDAISRIFAEIYTIPKAVRSDYYRLKIMELLLYLSCIDPREETQGRIYSSQQVDLVKQVHKRLTAQLDTRFTIDELAREYCISPTALKSYFKGVYGKPISAYMKEYRVRRSESLLKKTDMTVAEIALAVGYESQSNFGAVFKDLTGETPMEYRKKFEY